MPIDEIGDVEVAPRFGKGGDRRGDQHRRDVAQAQLARVDLDAEAAHEREQRLRGERDRDVVARAVEPGHDAVAESWLSRAPTTSHRSRM